MSNETHTHSHDHDHTYTHDHGDEIIVCCDVHKWYGDFEALRGVSAQCGELLVYEDRLSLIHI